MILVTGATGNVGRELVHQLVDLGEEVRGLSRSGPVQGDLNDPSSLGPALDGVSALFLLSGYPGVVEAARAAGVTRVVLMSGSSAETRDLDNAIARYMIASEEEVRSSGLEWTVLRPRTFMSNTLQWAPQLAAGDVVRAPWPDVAVATVDPADIAAVAAQALIGTRHLGQVYPVTGPAAWQPRERVALLGTALGRPLRYEPQPDDEARAEMLTTMPPEYVDAFFDFFSEGKLDESEVFPTVREVAQRPPRTFEEWARANAAKFRVG